MKFKVLTLFPDIIRKYAEYGILGRAIELNKLHLEVYNLRDYGIGSYKQVDDEPYGGGAGMLIRFDVLANAIDDIKEPNDKVVLLSPQGNLFNNTMARAYAEDVKDLILVCGRYEGVDQRFIDFYVDEELSIGDFVISGGELAALVVVDAVSRFVPDVVGDINSVYSDSFENGLLKYPQYTRPASYKNKMVPKVLLSGNHKLIKEWREKKALEITLAKRSDLLEKK